MPEQLQWYKKIWTLDIQDMSWVEPAVHEVDFVVESLELRRQDRVLDLACGFGRHTLELARRGYSVVGVDITPEYIGEARRKARQNHLDAQFVCADLRDVSFSEEFDVVLNLADGAVGYLENDRENLKVFDLIASALRPNGKHLMEICNATYANRHFPRRHWQMGRRSISLADFSWDSQESRMLYTGYLLKYGETLTVPEGTVSSIRLYTPEELCEILQARGMAIRQAYGGYDRTLPASGDRLALVVYSQKADGR
jgi:2-polyprenyl-3-methyl-5-hydroxy-6-metoxy-1,4-benzoquinol methylase